MSVEINQGKEDRKEPCFRKQKFSLCGGSVKSSKAHTEGAEMVLSQRTLGWTSSLPSTHVRKNSEG